jgi:acyl-CoA thioester hydrolase
LRSLGYSQRVLVEEPGIVFAVVSLNIEYRKPAKLDDELVITCEPAMDGPATIVFAQRIYRSNVPCGREGTSEPEYAARNLLVEARARVACLDARTHRPKRLPDFLTRAALPTGTWSNNQEPKNG